MTTCKHQPWPLLFGKCGECRIEELERALAESKAELLDDKGQDIRITLGGRIADLTAALAAAEDWRCIGPDAPESDCRSAPLEEMCVACAAHELSERAEKAEAALAAAQAESMKLREALEEMLRITRETLGVAGLTMPVLVNGSCKALERTAVAALALKADNAALVDVCERIGVEAWEDGRESADVASGIDYRAGVRRVEAIVARVLGGGK